MDKEEKVRDIFNEELEKEYKKIEKKIEKEMKMEMKEKKKKGKVLEKLEEINDDIEEFQVSKPKEILSEAMDEFFKPTRLEKLEQNMKIEEKESNNPFLNGLLVLFSIILFVITGDYLLYNIHINYVDAPTMINSVLLSCMVVFYLLSLLVKKLTVKKIFELLSIISIISFMAYHLFLA